MQTEASALPTAAVGRVLLFTVLLTGVAASGGAALGRLAVTAWQRVGRPGPTTVDEAAIALVGSVATVLLVSWALSLACALMGHLPGRPGRAARGVVPRVATRGTRRLAALLVGTALTGVLVPSSASAGHGHGTSTTTGSVTAAPLAPRPQPGFVASIVERVVTVEPPGWTPTRPAVRPQPDTALVTRGSVERRSDEVVVHRGDCLWDIAARHLGPGASDAEVALAWPAWHEANRSVIGEDPDHLLPGQLLRPPRPVTR